MVLSAPLGARGEGSVPLASSHRRYIASVLIAVVAVAVAVVLTL